MEGSTMPAACLCLGVSACLLGRRVRYDGGHKAAPALLAWLAAAGPRVQVLPLCPEAEAGLGVPRPPVELEAGPGGLRAVGVEDPSLDVTAALEAQARAALPTLSRMHGLLLKARSPSCGLAVPVRGSPPSPAAFRSPGLFAGAVARALPGLPLAEESVLEDPAAWRAFLEAALARRRGPGGRPAPWEARLLEQAVAAVRRGRGEDGAAG
ncbi:MAG: DUF523 domain-containing protein [Gammaproteobacteria bacterium]|nr:MAG: DUF523 domain-containing protein [Gammaproteobacteria bacterium]